MDGEFQKILVDEGSSADIIFTSTIDAMKIDRKMLGRAEHPLYGFGRKRSTQLEE